MQEVKAIAEKMGVSVGKMKKAELIRAVQRKECNAACFDTGISSHCGQKSCLWMPDCK